MPTTTVDGPRGATESRGGARYHRRTLCFWVVPSTSSRKSLLLVGLRAFSSSMNSQTLVLSVSDLERVVYERKPLLASIGIKEFKDGH
ncbi:hypothetical protein L1049_026286 [Liquidambar formosana]|uniref:Uncharacterized protein n=1 Tax=Liquidambar formosana TaxID=63359 RepID=A0AAP0R7D5_LIQFO